MEPKSCIEIYKVLILLNNQVKEYDLFEIKKKLKLIQVLAFKRGSGL